MTLADELCASEIAELARIFAAKPLGPGLRLRGNHELVATFASQCAQPIAEMLLGERAVPVRAILFEKTPDANWLVPWHQDVTLAAPEKLDLHGFSNWTCKDGMWHVQPPVEILSRMVAIRQHLDDCTGADGPLRVIPGSHRQGKLSDAEVQKFSQSSPKSLVVNAGQVIAMHPLTIHSSPESTGRSRRRVLHIEYCSLSVYPF